MIQKKIADPSREDAVRLKRMEKIAILHMMYAATILDELQEDLRERFAMINGAADRLKTASETIDGLIKDVRVTVPMNQRVNIENTASDYEIRLMPKLTPSTNSVVMTKEEFRVMVDSARTKCRNCADDDTECEKCELYKLLTSVLPLDDYHQTYLCPYNLGKWAN